MWFLVVLGLFIVAWARLQSKYRMEDSETLTETVDKRKRLVATGKPEPTKDTRSALPRKRFGTYGKDNTSIVEQIFSDMTGVQPSRSDTTDTPLHQVKVGEDKPNYDIDTIRRSRQAAIPQDFRIPVPAPPDFSSQGQ